MITQQDMEQARFSGKDRRRPRYKDARWPTPDSSMKEGYNRTPTKGGKKRPQLSMLAKDWPTPTVPGGGPECRDSRTARGSGGEDLRAAVQAWPTPQTNDSRMSKKNKRGNPMLGGMAGQWSTPTAEDADGRKYTYDKGNKDNPRPSLTGQVWMTPRSNDWKDRSLPEQTPTNSYLSRQAPRTPMPGKESSSSTRSSPRHLNPLFVEWLMGLPPGLINLEPLEMQSFQSWRQRHSLLSGGGSVSK
jgi:hypothetical protein